MIAGGLQTLYDIPNHQMVNHWRKMVDLVIIHGPPAAGKYTTATELAALTGARVFHNHVTLDVAKSLYEFGVPEFWELVDELRLLSFRSYFKNGSDTMVYTWCYEHPKNLDFYEAIKSIADSKNGRILPVYLNCEVPHLESRVTNPERKKMKKLSSIEGLRKTLATQIYGAIPHERCIELDSGTGSAKNNALKIAVAFGL